MIYDFSDYKGFIRSRVIELKHRRKAVSLKWLAEKLEIQYTYFSKVINSESIHFSEDQLFEIGESLELNQTEIDFFILLRNYQASNHPKRKLKLEKRINSIRSTKKFRSVTKEINQLQKEQEFMISPKHWLVFWGLTINKWKSNPDGLLGALGINRNRLKQILSDLESAGLIERDPATNSVTKINQMHIHYTASHPLMRTHQQMIKNYSDSHFIDINEERKVRLMATFTTNEEVFNALKSKMYEYMKEAEKLVVDSKETHCYQINFELFPWF